MFKTRKTCGLDVHKDTIFCAIYDEETKNASEVKVFNTLISGIKEMGNMLKAQGVSEIAMESTAIYWVTVWNVLESMGFILHLANPYLIKQMPGRKSDTKDAQWIATLLHKGLIKSSLVPCSTIQELRVYSRKYMKLQQKRTSTLVEIEKNMELCGIRITSFVSNITAKSITKVISAIIEGNHNPDELVELIHGRILKKHGYQTIRDSLEGFVTPQHKLMLELLVDELNLIDKQIDRCLSEMRHLCKKHYDKEMQILQTIPGVCEISAMIIIAETGNDMKAFTDSSKMSGWIGLRPRNDESAGKYKSTATTKGNKYLRAILVQIAWAASRTKGSYFKEKFNQLAVRKPRKKALIAIARKISVVIWNLLSKQKEYDPKMVKIYDPQKLEAKQQYYKKQLEKLEKIMV